MQSFVFEENWENRTKELIDSESDLCIKSFQWEKSWLEFEMILQNLPKKFCKKIFCRIFLFQMQDSTFWPPMFYDYTVKPLESKHLNTPLQAAT